MDKPQLILASASPRRRELLQLMGLEFTVEVADIEEIQGEDEAPPEFVMRLALDKAHAVANRRSDDTVVLLAADTIVVINNDVLGKPACKADGCAMLSRLSGKTHQVLTAVAVCFRGRCWQALSESRVSFTTLSSVEIEAYWQSGEPVDKAGAYGIQGLAAGFVSKIEGSYSGVVGLPLYETRTLLNNAGIDWF